MTYEAFLMPKNLSTSKSASEKWGGGLVLCLKMP